MWSDENVKLLTDLWTNGLSAGQIAARLGCSRSMVCAKLQRLGLKRGPKPPTAKPVILAVRKPPGDLVRRPSPVRHEPPLPSPRRPLPHVDYTKPQLYEMLAQAVRNTR
jgi:GcrA cell cycle regulator